MPPRCSPIKKMLGDTVNLLAVSHRRARRRPNLPSPYLISFLATISAATPSDALPLRDCSFLPEYLCPRLFKRDQQDLAPTEPSLYRSASSSSRPQATNTLDSRDVPDHYVKGADGLWYQLPYATSIPCSVSAPRFYFLFSPIIAYILNKIN